MDNDWFCILAKIEKNLSDWSHKWLSRAGWLVLVKVVLEVMSVYWMALTWIPRGILDKIRRLCFYFIWSGKREKRVMPWARWERIALPKYLGGWGLKNIYNFSKALAMKVGWNFISTTRLWNEVVWNKYISPSSLIDWIRAPVWRDLGISVIWKVVLASLDVICFGMD